jgi:hypothetical protein
MIVPVLKTVKLEPFGLNVNCIAVIPDSDTAIFPEL